MFSFGVLDHLFELLAAKIRISEHIDINCELFVFPEIEDEVQVTVQAHILEALSESKQFLCWRRFSFQAGFG